MTSAIDGRRTNVLRDFERQAIAAMAGDTLDATHLALLADIARFERYAYTGCGDYATVAHPKLPQTVGMLASPKVMGLAETGAGHVVRAGFVCYLDPGRLTLECHTWGEFEIPEDFRDLAVTIRTIE